MKKMGRPTDNPKRHEVKVRLDEETYQILADYCQRMDRLISDGVRDAIKLLPAAAPSNETANYPTILLLGAGDAGKRALMDNIFDIALPTAASEQTHFVTAYPGRSTNTTVDLLDISADWGEDYTLKLHDVLIAHTIHLIWYCLPITNEQLRPSDIAILKFLLEQEHFPAQRLSILLTKCEQDSPGGIKAWRSKNNLRQQFSLAVNCFETSSLAEFPLELSTLLHLSRQALADENLQHYFGTACHLENI